MIKKEISKDLIDRLVCAKYLYWSGIQVLDDNASFSAGMSVLNFHDATEIILRVIAEYFDASIKEYENFPSLINKVNGKTKELGLSPLKNSSALSQLNKARVNFKHHALEPKYKDANKFKVDLEFFFKETLDQYLSLNFLTLSLADLVNHKRTSNWLHKAEKNIENSNPYKACACSAIAFEIFRNYKKRPSLWDTFNSLGSELGSYSRDRQITAGTKKLAHEVDDKLDKLRKYIDILFDGIDPLKYKKFVKFTPNVAISIANTIIHPSLDENGLLSERVKDLLPDISNEIALFCYEFSINSVLQLQSQNFPPEHEFNHKEILFVTNKETPIYVYHKSKEIIDRASEGAILKSASYVGNSENDNFVTILYDEERAYVPKKNIRKSSPLSLKEESAG